MRGEDGLDEQAGKPTPQVDQRDAALAERLEDGAESASLGLTRAQVVDAPAEPVDALGHVGELEVGRERAHDLERETRFEVGQDRGELALRRLVAAVPPARGQTCAFDGGEQLRRTLLAQDLAEHAAQPRDVLAERPVLGGERDGLIDGAPLRLRGSVGCRAVQPWAA